MFTVKDLMHENNFELISGEKGLNNSIDKAQVSRPGLELAGLFDFYEHDRIQVMGSKEVTFYGWLNNEDKNIRVKMLFEQSPPTFIFSKNTTVPELFIKYSNEFGIPIFKSSKKTSALISTLYLLLSSKLSERISEHGVLLDVNGIGVFNKRKKRTW